MFYVKNLPFWERTLRLSAGASVAAYALLYLSGWSGRALVGCGASLALTGMIGFCPACALAGRRLAKRARASGPRASP